MLKWEKVDVFDVFDGNNIDETIEKLKKLKEQYKDGRARFNVEFGETYSTSEHAYTFHLLGEKK
jgi:hypothetical protein